MMHNLNLIFVQFFGSAITFPFLTAFNINIASLLSKISVLTYASFRFGPTKKYALTASSNLYYSIAHLA